MTAIGSQFLPVRTHPSAPIEINSPDGFMTQPPGELWWVGFHHWWDAAVPPAVTRATAVIVNPLVRMPWLVITPAGDQLAPGDPRYPSWLSDPMLLNGASGGPNRGYFPMLDRLDRFGLFSRWVRDALQLGTGLLAFQPDSSGQPITGTMHPLSPVSLQRSGEGDWALTDQAGAIHDIAPDGTVTVGSALWRVLPLRHSMPGGVFHRHSSQLQLAERITQYAGESLNSATPSGVLSTEQPINQAAADTIREEWERTQSRRRIAVIGNGARYQQVVMSPVEAELVSMARLSNEQVAHMFELAAWHLDASTNDMTYSNAQENRQELVDGTLASWSARIEDTIGSLLPWGWQVRIDFTRYTTPTTTGGQPL